MHRLLYTMQRLSAIYLTAVVGALRLLLLERLIILHLHCIAFWLTLYVYHNRCVRDQLPEFHLECTYTNSKHRYSTIITSVTSVSNNWYTNHHHHHHHHHYRHICSQIHCTTELNWQCTFDKKIKMLTTE